MAAKKAATNKKKSTESTARVTRIKSVDSSPSHKAHKSKAERISKDEVALETEEFTPAGEKETVVIEPINKAHPGQKRSVGKRLMDPRFLAMIIAEFLGTFVLTAIVLASQGQSIMVMFALIAIVLAVGTISGAFVNPAFAIAAWATKRISALRALAFVVAEVMGAVVAMTALSMFINAAPASEPNMFGGGGSVELFKASAVPKGHEWLTLAAEMIGTFIFALGVARATRTENAGIAAATVGGSAFLGLAIATACATSIKASAILNPAVAAGLQALAPFNVWSTAIYVVGTTIAAIIGFVVYDILSRATNVEQKAIVTARD